MTVEIYSMGKGDDQTVTVLIDGNSKRFNSAEAAFVYADSKVEELKSAIDTAKLMFVRT